jgi:flagellar protein FliO/FliZ
MRTPVNQFITVVASILFLPAVWAEQTAQAGLPVNTVNTGSVLQMFFGLAVVVGLILGVAWFMRRMGQFQGQANSNMKVVAGMSLGQRERVLLLQVGETQLLIGTAPGSIRTLHVFDEPVISADSTTAPAGFAKHLNSVLKNRTPK